MKSHAQKVAQRDPNFASLKPESPNDRAKRRKTITTYKDSVDTSMKREDNSSPAVLEYVRNESTEPTMGEVFSEASHPPNFPDEATLLASLDAERKRGFYQQRLNDLFRVADFNNEREVLVKPDGSRAPICQEKLLRVRIFDTLLWHKQSGWFMKEVQPNDAHLDEHLAVFVIMGDCPIWYEIHPNTPFLYQEIDAIFSIMSLTTTLWEILQLNAVHISYVRMETINGVINKFVSQATSVIMVNTPHDSHQTAHSFH